MAEHILKTWPMQWDAVQRGDKTVEVTRGVMEREIEPDMGWTKIIPGGPTGTVVARFRVRPVTEGQWHRDYHRAPRLRPVDGDAGEVKT